MTAFEHYQRWCQSLGIKPASRAIYEQERRAINDNPAGFARYGKDLLLHAGRKLRKAYTLRIGEALGAEDEKAMLRALGLMDADSNVTPEGESVSRIRSIDGAKYRLWAVDRVAALLGKATEAQEEPEPLPDALVIDVLRSTASQQLEAA